MNESPLGHRHVVVLVVAAVVAAIALIAVVSAPPARSHHQCDEWEEDPIEGIWV